MKQFFKIISISTLTILLLGIVCCAGSLKNEQSSLRKETLEIGQSVRSSSIEVAVLQVKREGSYGEMFTKKAKEGKVILIVTASIKNIGDEIEYAEDNDFSLSDSEGFKYEPRIDIANAPWHTKLFPGEKVEGKLVFEVPKTATGLKVNYNIAGMLEKPKLVHWAIRQG